ncbi:UNVERIFIED_CONTAM: hypothetical protein O8I53_09620 [Campylobacter lari]
MFNIFFFTALSLFTEIIVDVSFTFLDPRIVFESNSGIDLIRFMRASIARRKEKKLLMQEYANKLNESKEV